MSKKPTQEEFDEIALKEHVDELFQDMEEAFHEWEQEIKAAEAAKQGGGGQGG